MKRCPKCGGREFLVVQHVTQTIKVDGDGSFLEEISSCDETVRKADDDDIWDCANCGYSDVGSVFNVEDKR